VDLSLPPVDIFGQTVIVLAACLFMAGLFAMAEKYLFPLPSLATPTHSPPPPYVYTPPLPEPAALAPIGDDVYQKTYVWELKSPLTGFSRQPQQFSVELAISKERYEHYRAAPRNVDRVAYTSEWMPELDHLVAKLHTLHINAELEPFEQAANVLAFVQATVRYMYNREKFPDMVDSPQYPIESLVDQTGDCEDHAILAAAILKNLGFDVALLVASEPPHVALGLACVPGTSGEGLVTGLDGRVYHYVETTAVGWRFGELPPDMSNATVTVHPVPFVTPPLSTVVDEDKP
jgi:predicted transglutaminase-like cysteine proteinase